MGWWGLDEAVRRGCVGGWALGAAPACPGGLGKAYTEKEAALEEQRQPGRGQGSGRRQADAEGATQTPGNQSPAWSPKEGKRLGTRVRLAKHTKAPSLA